MKTILGSLLGASALALATARADAGPVQPPEPSTPRASCWWNENPDSLPKTYQDPVFDPCGL